MTEQELAKAEELREHAEKKKNRVKAGLSPIEEEKSVEPERLVFELHESEAMRKTLKNAVLEIEGLKNNIGTVTENQNNLALDQAQIMQRLNQVEAELRDFRKNLQLQIDTIIDLKKDELERTKKTLDKVDQYLDEWL
jgi:hypothetical protein